MTATSTYRRPFGIATLLAGKLKQTTIVQQQTRKKTRLQLKPELSSPLAMMQASRLVPAAAAAAASKLRPRLRTGHK